jgi:hypothetical protein
MGENDFLHAMTKVFGNSGSVRNHDHSYREEDDDDIGTESILLECGDTDDKEFI